MVPFHWGLLGHPRRELPYTRPEHVRMCLEEMGATFIKLGQVLSTRPDLLPPEYIAELSKLRDSAPPVPFRLIQETIEAELGAPLDDTFATFDPHPIACASIGQVHTATLKTREQVVVKVQKPGVQRQVETDLAILTELANRGRRAYGSMYDFGALVDEFAWTLRGEIDYLREGRNAEILGRNFAEVAGVQIPNIHWQCTTSRVLVMGRVSGERIEAAIHQGHVPSGPELAERLIRWFLKQVFEDGFFHADPHPGNFFVQEDGTLGIVDFGMVGTIDEESRYGLLKMLQALGQQDSWAVVDLMSQLGATGGSVNRSALVREVHRALSRYYGLELREMKLGPLINDLMGTVRRHRLHLPADLAVLLKALVMLEGLAERIHPGFRIADVLEPYSEEALTRLKAAEIWGRRLARGTAEAAALSAELPAGMRRLLGLLERGDLELSLKHDEFGQALSSLNSMLRRLSLAVMLGAAVVAWATLRRRDRSIESSHDARQDYHQGEGAGKEVERDRR